MGGSKSVYVAEGDELVAVSVASGRRRVPDRRYKKLACSTAKLQLCRPHPVIADVSPDGALVAVNAEGGGGGYGGRRALIVLDRSGAGAFLPRDAALYETLTERLD